VIDEPQIRLLCSTVSLFPTPIHESFRLLALAGFDGAEVMVTKDPDTQDAGRLRELAEDHGLPIVAIHAPFLLMSRRVWGTDPLAKIERSTEFARAVGAEIVVVHPPYRWQTRYRRWLADHQPRMGTGPEISVAVENMFPLRVRGRKVARFHQELPLDDLGQVPHVVLDTSHAAVTGLDPLEAATRIGERLVHVHLSNNAGRGWDSHSPLDEGVLDLDAFLRGLRDRGWAGSVSLEVDLRRYQADEGSLLDALHHNRHLALAGFQNS
jgi:sugar phosphate isomerase/epimerase